MRLELGFEGDELPLESFEANLGYNGVDLDLPMPYRTREELVDSLYRFESKRCFGDRHIDEQDFSIDLPQEVKEGYVSLLRKRSEELHFGRFGSASMSWSLLRHAAQEFGHKYADRLLCTLTATPTAKWKEVWDHFHTNHAAQYDYGLEWGL